MIRFCDKEVACVAEKELDRQQILEYFLDGHRGELVCVMDDEGKFIGSISYLAILGRELDESVNPDCIVLGTDRWEEWHKCFERCPMQSGVDILLPVIDEERNLLCFAYEDYEADQELRMLDELTSFKSALGFCDIYPEYGHVWIHGCNELAYHFAIYLKNMGVSFRVLGDLWEKFAELANERGEIDKDILDYRIMDIYGEGTAPKEERIELRKSVSPEFECIDKIYEENIQKGIIFDTEETVCAMGILQFLKEKHVAVVGVGSDALDACDLLLEHGIDVCCFVANENKGDYFGIKVFRKIEAMETWEDIVFIQPDKKHSAWGFGETNQYHNLGYKRNKNFFLLQDYMEIPQNGAKNVIKAMLLQMTGKLVLIGDLQLCTAMKKAYEVYYGLGSKIVYYDILKEYVKEEIDEDLIQATELCKDDCIMLFLPKLYGCFEDRELKVSHRKKLVEKYEKALRKYDVPYFIDYPFENIEWMRPENLFEGYGGCEEERLKPKRIILGSIDPYSGNLLFGGIMDGHLDILKIRPSTLCANMYSICVRLAMEPASRILPLFWKLNENMIFRENDYQYTFPKKDVFSTCMSDLLEEKDRYSSYELFIMIHIAYGKMLGKEIKNISDMTIYWEPHTVPRDETEDYAKWLDKIKEEGYIVNIVRNFYMKAGTNVRTLGADRPIERTQAVLSYTVKEKKSYRNWGRIIMKFEDLKCKPKELMQSFCEKTGLEWSDTLLDVQTSFFGVKGFDLAPVYRTWEEFFSSFDRFRICLITGPWQRRYGYPYVSSLDFNRKELSEIFCKKFRFEENWVFCNDELENAFIKWRQNLINELLWEARRKDILKLHPERVENICIN